MHLGISPSTAHYIIKKFRESVGKDENHHWKFITFDPLDWLPAHSPILACLQSRPVPHWQYVSHDEAHNTTAEAECLHFTNTYWKRKGDVAQW